MSLIGGLGAGLTKSNGGSVKVTDMRWESASGYTLAGQIFVPPNATKDNPAPAVACAHGWMLNREYQDKLFIELSRRGYVVLSIDLYGHGWSQDAANNEWWEADGSNGANGLYDAVQLLASLPYVDSSKIGVTGNSNGATASNLSVLLDNEAPEQLISSVFLVVNEPLVSRDQALVAAYLEEANDDFYNPYGQRDVGLVAAKYDEVFNRVVLKDGTITPPRDFIDQTAAQVFLYYGEDPAGRPARQAGTVYQDAVDGTEAMRVIYNPAMIHAWTHDSLAIARQAVSFFEQAMPAPNPLPPSNQVAGWKEVSSAVGTVGLLVFFVALILALLKVAPFNRLAASGAVSPVATTRRGRVWLWAGLSCSALFAMVSFPLVWVAGVLTQPSFFNQQAPFVFANWSLLNGLFTILVLFLTYRRYSRQHGLDLREQGVTLPRRILAWTALLGLISAVSTYGLVFLVDYLFKTDFHIWLLFGINAFDADRLVTILKYWPFLLVFWAANSVAMNVFNYVKIGRREWVNTFWMCVFNVLGVALWFVFIYAYFFTTGNTPTDYLAWGVSSWINWLWPMLVILPLATVAERIIYKATRNPYLPAIGISLLVTAMLCARTLTMVG
ncbi:MAG: prolyl oligopeptidase family serine peptidase [Bifidobacteriaceae bacterium]|nr:prolyl oligopeptidase family serine peptidase [Bifidobacteriaceae bacterium]